VFVDSAQRSSREKLVQRAVVPGHVCRVFAPLCGEPLQGYGTSPSTGRSCLVRVTLPCHPDHMGSPDIVNDRPVKGPSTDHAYSLAKAYGDLAIEQTYDIPQLRENAELARQLESMLSHAMQAVHDIAEDNKLWDALRSAREGIDSRRFEDLIGFTQLSLEPLLSASGYKPPPPLYELVGRTQAALIVAGEASRQRKLTGEELVDARHYLRFLMDRTREKLDPRFAPRHAAPVMAAASGSSPEPWRDSTSTPTR
jgi:hypothetical protein